MLAIEHIGKVAVARFSSEVTLTGQQAEAVAEELRSLLKDFGSRRLLVDFSNVASLASLMLGKLVNLNREAEAVGGRLALCNLKPVIYEIFDVTRLSKILAIYRSESEALMSF
jgi:anti-anti-sigma factor